MQQDQAQDQGASAEEADRATRPSDQAAARLGDAASVPCAIAEKLREARALIERGWCQKKFHIGQCFCAVGAVYHVTADADEQTEDAVLSAIRGELNVERTSDVFEWNDAPERTRGEVLAVFDKAIELAEQVTA